MPMECSVRFPNESSPFRFDAHKAVQAAGVLLREEPFHKMNYMKLIKLMYIAEREALKAHGRMITGDRVVAMQRGPVLSSVLDLINGTHIGVEAWDRHIERERYHAMLKSNPGVNLLSRFEIELLQDVAKQYRNNDEWEMVEITHKFEEWKKNKPVGSSCNDVSLRDILEGVGIADPTKVLQEAVQQARFNDFFSRHGACSKETPSPSPSQVAV